MICKKCGAIISNDDLFNHKCYDSKQNSIDNNNSVPNPLDSIFDDKKHVFNIFNDENNLDNNHLGDIFTQDKDDNVEEKPASVKVDSTNSIDNFSFDNNKSITNNSSNGVNDLDNDHLGDIFTQDKDDNVEEKPASVKVDSTDNSSFDNNSSITNNSSNGVNDLDNNHLGDIFTQNKDDNVEEKSASVKVDSTDNSSFDNNKSISNNSSNGVNDLDNNHLGDIFTQNKDDNVEEKSVSSAKANSNDNIGSSLFIDNEDKTSDDTVVLSDKPDIGRLSSLNNKGNSLFITIFVIFAFVFSLSFIFLFRDRLFGTLKGENFRRSEDCKESIKNAYNEYVELYGKTKLKAGTCIIITNTSKKINFNIGDNDEKIVEYRDGKFYQDSIALDNYKLAISYNKDDMAALKKGNNNLINSFYFDSNEILK